MLPHLLDGQLQHPVWEFDWSEVMQVQVIVCCVVLFLSGILCSAAGIGGGGVYVSVLMVVGLLSPHDAVPLSKAVVFFGAVITMAMNLIRMKASAASPQASASIDFMTVRVVAPAALAGTYFGVLLNWHAQGYMIVVTLTALLAFMTWLVGRTAWEQHRAEEAMAGGHTAIVDAGGEQPQPQDDAQEDMPLLPRAARSGKAETEPYNSRDVALAFALTALVVVSGVVRFHLKACEMELAGHTDGACGHWIMQTLFVGQVKPWLTDPVYGLSVKSAVTAVPLLSCLLASGWTGNYVRSRAGWAVSDVFKYQAMGLATGLFAGLVGIGGGLIFSPFFLLAGMDPASAVATSSTCVLFTSSSTTLQYMFTDRVIMTLALVYGITTTAASYLGTRLVHTMQDAFHGKKSYISLIVALAVAISAVMSLGKLVTMTPSQA